MKKVLKIAGFVSGALAVIVVAAIYQVHRELGGLGKGIDLFDEKDRDKLSRVI